MRCARLECPDPIRNLRPDGEPEFARRPAVCRQRPEAALQHLPAEAIDGAAGETVQYTTYDGMSVVQITPAHPDGNYVVALHGGAFVWQPAIFSWLDYSVMAYQTGATFEVPIYPLLQQGGTAGAVVPQIAGFLSAEIAAHGAPTSACSVTRRAPTSAWRPSNTWWHTTKPYRRHWFCCLQRWT